MDRLKALALFKAVVDNGSFVGAANSLDLSCTVVTRTVQELEASLGARLLHRTTRRIALTAAGQDVLDRVPALLLSYEELTAVGRKGSIEPSGVVRLSAPTWVGRYYLGPTLASFRRLYPRVLVALDLCAVAGDLGIGSNDLSLCLAEDLRPSHFARPLAELAVGIYAAPSYLARGKHPALPADLADHDCLIAGTARAGARWCFVHTTGEERHVQVRAALQANHADVLADAALHGAGIVMLPEVVARRAVAQGRLLRLLPDWGLEPMSIHVAYASRQNQPLAARRLIDHLVDAFGQGSREHGTALSGSLPMQAPVLLPPDSPQEAGCAVRALAGRRDQEAGCLKTAAAAPRPDRRASFAAPPCAHGAMRAGTAGPS